MTHITLMLVYSSCEVQLAMATFHCLHSIAPHWCSSPCSYSAFTSAHIVRPTRLVTVGDREFSVAAAKLWNKLAGSVTASQVLTAFFCQLKSVLFRNLYLEIA